MADVFVSYRRRDAGWAQALYQRLAAVLGETSVFMDVEHIASGDVFPQLAS